MKDLTCEFLRQRQHSRIDQRKPGQRRLFTSCILLASLAKIANSTWWSACCFFTVTSTAHHTLWDLPWVSVWTVSAGYYAVSVIIQVLVHCSAEWCRNSGPSCKAVEHHVSLGFPKFRDDVRQTPSNWQWSCAGFPPYHTTLVHESDANINEAANPGVHRLHVCQNGSPSSAWLETCKSLSKFARQQDDHVRAPCDHKEHLLVFLSRNRMSERQSLWGLCQDLGRWHNVQWGCKGSWASNRVSFVHFSDFVYWRSLWLLWPKVTMTSLDMLSNGRVGVALSVMTWTMAATLPRLLVSMCVSIQQNS